MLLLLFCIVTTIAAMTPPIISTATITQTIIIIFLFVQNPFADLAAVLVLVFAVFTLLRLVSTFRGGAFGDVADLFKSGVSLLP